MDLILMGCGEIQTCEQERDRETKGGGGGIEHKEKEFIIYRSLHEPFILKCRHFLFVVDGALDSSIIIRRQK